MGGGIGDEVDGPGGSAAAEHGIEEVGEEGRRGPGVGEDLGMRGVVASLMEPWRANPRADGLSLAALWFNFSGVP